jgi:hypothetical protein
MDPPAGLPAVEVVDLRRAGDDVNIVATSPPPPKRRVILVGFLLVVIGAVLGWLVASPSDPTDTPSAPESSAPVAPTPRAATQDPQPGTVAQDVDMTQGSESAAEQQRRPDRELTLQAGVTALGAVGQLAGPITLVPGLEVVVLMHLDPSGTVSIQMPEPPLLASEAPSPPFMGLPLASVADGVLFAPLAGSLGAVAYWQPEIGVSLPLPDEASTASYLAASGDLGVFLSAGEVVVRNLALGVEVVRLDADISGLSLVQACVSPDTSAIALIARDGLSRVFDMETGEVVQTFVTTTTLRGVAWSAPGQIVYLIDGTGNDRLVQALDITSGQEHAIASLHQGSNWKLTTDGPSC